MHFYQFNISDYKSHTEHLSDLEDLAYRRMLDWCYLHESPLPKDKKDIARLIRMREHCDCIAVVLREFFTKDKNGDYINKRIFLEINRVNEKSSKARESAQARWAKASSDANALQTECERYATQDTIPKTQDTIPKKKRASPFLPPSLVDVKNYIFEFHYEVDADSFINFYESKGWMVGRNKMKDWKAAIRTWHTKNTKGQNNGQNQNNPKSKQFFDTLDELAQKDIRENGFTDTLGN